VCPAAREGVFEEVEHGEEVSGGPTSLLFVCHGGTGYGKG
jgi:hypothetical protein